MNVASAAGPGSVWPGATKATWVLRSGEAAGPFVTGSMNEKTNLNGPFTWSPMISGITDGWAAVDGAGVGDGLQAAATSARTAASSTKGRAGKRSMDGA